MRSRALSLAALALLVSLCGWTSAGVRPAAAQALDAGKPPAQIFNGTCAACHRSPRGLVRNVSPGSLPGFLRQHYTTGNDMAGTMATYVLGNGGTDRVAEPPKREPKEPREHRQKAKTDTPEVAARTPEAKEQAKTARQQKAGRKGPEPAAAPTPPEPEKVEAPREAPKETLREAPKTEPAVVEPAKSETAATDCKVELAKQAADDRSGAATPPSIPSRQSLLTLPGFPAPEPEPEPEPVATAMPHGCDPPTTTAVAAPRAEEPPKEVAAPKEAPREQPKEEPKETIAVQPPPVPASTPAPAPAASIAQVANPEPPRAAVADSPPALDIMQEEVHGPRAARVPQQQKKRAQ